MKSVKKIYITRVIPLSPSGLTCHEFLRIWVPLTFVMMRNLKLVEKKL